MDMQDTDEDAQMREMMGFGSFGTQKPDTASSPSSTYQLSHLPIGKKPKLNNGEPLNTHRNPPPHADTLIDDKVPNLPAKPPQLERPITSMITITPTNTSTTAAMANNQNNSSSDTYSQTVYTNPTTGISFTRQELYDHGQGRKTNEMGDVVFFRPSFVDEDPWKGLRNKK